MCIEFLQNEKLGEEQGKEGRQGKLLKHVIWMYKSAKMKHTNLYNQYGLIKMWKGKITYDFEFILSLVQKKESW